MIVVTVHNVPAGAASCSNMRCLYFELSDLTLRVAVAVAYGRGDTWINADPRSGNLGGGIIMAGQHWYRYSIIRSNSSCRTGSHLDDYCRFYNSIYPVATALCFFAAALLRLEDMLLLSDYFLPIRQWKVSLTTAILIFTTYLYRCPSFRKGHRSGS